jgi:CheY-like chemotaxis protein
MTRVSVKLAKPRVLVVDDDEMVRFVIRTVLDSAEFDIVEAENGEQAVEKFSGPEGPFPLVLMDMFMPGMNGPEALRMIREKAPEARVVLLSGTPEHPANGGNLPGVTFFPKPFVNEELLSLVRKELAHQRPA